MPTRCLQAQKKPHRETRKDMTQRTSQKGEKQNHARAKSVEAANRGWMSEKYLPPADQVKCFFLTSPFIEPAKGIPVAMPGIIRNLGFRQRLVQPTAVIKEISACRSPHEPSEVREWNSKKGD